MEKEVLELFGGRERILRRMRNRVMRAFTSLPPEAQGYFYEQMQLDPAEGVHQIACANYRLLESAAMYLDINLPRAIGVPKFTKNNGREYWRQQMCEKPMTVANVPRRRIPKSYEISSYLITRAIGELAQAA